ncbi:MAG: biopolymer transport protein [Hydrocarboniphaga sp.]|uniref:ExbD/TolR family protein n=1 Tax=Hydrocarboniphaga sp. TaxID=2033016 RepID=UPI0026167F36|nr:biopolymer transporter ExbD [Hydrocarboniphaga sp.]MDB5972970.1 biopolymer transport protein [Hydrocarboniphaga sp.]
MKIRGPKPRNPGAIDMVPMINFAFLLLIFVILAGVIQAPEVLTASPPHSAAQTAPDSAPDTLVIDAQGRIGFGGEIIEPDVLLTRAQAWQHSAGDRALIVKADAGADAQRVVMILEVLRAAGVVRASLLTTTRSG